MTITPTSTVYTQSTGSSSTKTFVDVFLPRDPNGNDTAYQIQQKWYNTVVGSYWMLVGFSCLDGVVQAIWLAINDNISDLDRITLDGPITITPLLNNINFHNGNGIVITGSGNDITFSVAGGGFSWIKTSSSVATMGLNKGYFAISPGGALTFGLPTTSVLGDAITVNLSDATSWQITQGAGQQIRFGNVSTTLGAGGSIASTAQGDSITIVCKTANLIWESVASIGNLTVV